MSWMADVMEFHKKMGCETGDLPKAPKPNGKTAKLRIKLIKEELNELKAAIKAKDIVEIADGLADLCYVTLGSAAAFGIDLEPIWKEVHESNLRKDGSKKRKDGKITKPEGWNPPQIEKILDRQLGLKEIYE